MADTRFFSVEAKTFIFKKEGNNSFRITERNRRMALFLLISGAAASWVVKMVEEATEYRWRESFFKKLRVGNNGVLTLHLLRNARGCYLLLEEFNNGRRRGSLIIPEGVESCGWEGFAYNLKKVVEHKVVPTVGCSSQDGKTVSYAAVVAGSKAENSSAMVEKEGRTSLFPQLSVRNVKLGEIEGVFWDVRARLSGVFQEVSTLMKKVDLGLSYVMEIGKHSSDSSHVSGQSSPKEMQVSARKEYKEKGNRLGMWTEKGKGVISGINGLDPQRALSPSPRPSGPRPRSSSHTGSQSQKASSPSPRCLGPILTGPRAASPQPPPGPITSLPGTRFTQTGQQTFSASSTPDPATQKPPTAADIPSDGHENHPKTLQHVGMAGFLTVGASQASVNTESTQKVPAVAPATQKPPTAAEIASDGHENHLKTLQHVGMAGCFTVDASQATVSTESTQTEPMGTCDPFTSLSERTPAAEDCFSSGPGTGEASEALFSHLGLSKDLSRVLCTEMEASLADGRTSDEEIPYDSDLQLTCREFGTDLHLTEMNETEDIPSPLCSLSPTVPWDVSQPDWVIQKVNDMCQFMGMSCEGFEDQMQALFIAIRAGQPSHAKSVGKKERELRRLTCSINYGTREGSASRGRTKDRVNLGDP
ncbi:hypothetical protein I3842_05G115900 [Carya illinoinensis]|uniref:Uncharacterized protein n=1 Tax=Carya illinoinensis TaxID=32201 RepID=A0A922EYI4_CARIL|nr:hypothetical protein I3842_05G115900 [Carya illinoinensis]